ncbi:THO complex subunit 1 transcription elongation factor [Musa troglodytarum]|uniref:THO complex subunit 1 transcription elongation factor n=1 Tax=Musa troglodytarum TaxID=320322 RepID=A0A9E7JQ92_9LILI|nr:THO complex subunit 1 transcription elongation factor [Musa troglodytarum]
MAAEAPSGLRILLHQHVKERGPVPVSSHADRDRVIEVFRKLLLKGDPPENFALQAVQEAIKPQKQTVLVQDENQSLENALRTLLQELVSSAVQSGERMMQYGQTIDEGESIHGQIPRFLDIVLHLCERGHVEGGMIFQLLEDLTEMSTIKDCKEIFGYIESKQDILGKQELFGRGKLVMLRTCNQLLRRLSKANDVVFCGRIIMFLAHFFPLSERSAVNIKGVFNTSNETKYEKDAPDGITVDFNFYKTFWSLQEHFSNPTSTTLAPSKWQKFAFNLMVVLDTFEAQPLNDDDGNVNNLEQEEEDAVFNIKYLTSSKLMGLELKDPSFRRHILVQCLILFDFLKTPGKNDKDGPSESMKEEIKSCEERVKKLLEVIPPQGKEFLQSIEHILEREKNWVWWKRDGCPAFEKQPTERKIGHDGAKKRKPRWRLGNKELSQLWKWVEQNPNALTDPQRVRMPSVTEYWKPLGEDMDVSAGIEAEYHHKNNRVYCWKGLRFSARQDLEGFSRFTDHGIEGVVPPELLPPEVRSKFHTKPGDKAKRAKKEEAKGAATQPEDSQVASAAVETDGVGSGAELEDGVAPMDSDATAGEGQKQSPDMDSGHEAGQSEAEGEAEGDAKTDVKMEVEAAVHNETSPKEDGNPTSRDTPADRDSNIIPTKMKLHCYIELSFSSNLMSCVLLTGSKNQMFYLSNKHTQFVSIEAFF